MRARVLAGLAALDRIADFDAGAELVVVALFVVRDVVAAIRGLVARVARAFDAVVACARRTGLAIVNGAADLDAVAERVVGAERVSRLVQARIGLLVAGVHGASDVVRTVAAVRARLAKAGAIALIVTVAEEAVVARRFPLLRLVHAVALVVAGIGRAEIAVVAIVVARTLREGYAVGRIRVRLG